MSRMLIGVPLGFLVTHRFDNEARLDEISAQGPAEIVILHGTDDEVIPVVMSRKLAWGRENTVRLVEIQGALWANSSRIPKGFRTPARGWHNPGTPTV